MEYILYGEFKFIFKIFSFHRISPWEKSCIFNNNKFNKFVYYIIDYCYNWNSSKYKAKKNNI